MAGATKDLVCCLDALIEDKAYDIADDLLRNTKDSFTRYDEYSKKIKERRGLDEEINE
jgi:hypothetical protein